MVEVHFGLSRDRSQRPSADLDLLLVAERAPMATMCLSSALARHELTDEIPLAHDIALPRGAWRPRVDAIVNWHSFAAKTFEAGEARSKNEPADLIRTAQHFPAALSPIRAALEVLQ